VCLTRARAVERSKVADAMAVSAAFPGVIGPFVIEADIYEWRKRETWDLPKDAAEIKPPPFDKLHLYDGGIYDNLGTEPLFDSGKQCQKDGTDFIMVSDAGAPLGRIAPGRFRPFRLKRVADIMSDQTRALRVGVLQISFSVTPKTGRTSRLALMLKKNCGPIVVTTQLPRTSSFAIHGRLRMTLLVQLHTEPLSGE
jgi:predicted acylesterase/phospholipase RssA